VSGAIGGLAQSSIRKILSFSSINHLGWALVGLSLRLSYWAIYFFLYCLLLLVVITLSKIYNVSTLTSASLFATKESKIAFYISLFSFGGLPPFIGFIPKWILIGKLAFLSPTLTFILVISSLPPLFYYLNLALLTIFSKTKNFIPQNNESKLPINAIILNILFTPIARLFLLW
jgi:NADH-ubiquinone oxidoreductase chain 2